jgi:hypothetical protein
MEPRPWSPTFAGTFGTSFVLNGDSNLVFETWPIDQLHFEAEFTMWGRLNGSGIVLSPFSRAILYSIPWHFMLDKWYSLVHSVVQRRLAFSSLLLSRTVRCHLWVNYL